MLTLRMVVVTIVGLFTSRIVLQVLGVDDYGIVGLVGGIIGLAGFLNAAMAGATSRFITYELGKGHIEKLQKVFSTSLEIHIVLASIVLFLGETVGLWFVNTQLVIPPNRIFAANWVYQFSIISMCIGFTQVPYSACIIAHERMNIYAYFELISTSLKLLLVYLLYVIPGDKLILYSGMYCALTSLMALCYRFYCIKNFSESRFKWIFSKEYFKPMLSFSSLDLYGNMCVTFRDQGIPVVINWFYGLVANAASAIALTITGTLSGLTMTITEAFRPQIVKQYATGDIKVMENLMCRSNQLTSLMFSLLGIPFITFMPEILYLWLGQIPVYAVIFTRLTIVLAFVGISNTMISLSIHATGNIKRISFYTGTIFTLVPILGYLCYYFGMSASAIYIVNIAITASVIISNVFIAKIQIPTLSVKKYVSSMIGTWIIFAIVLILVYTAKELMWNIEAEDIWSITAFCEILAYTIIGAILSLSLCYIFIFDKGTKAYILNKLIKFKTCRCLLS